MVEIEIDGVIGKKAGEISAAFVKSMLPADNSQPITVVIHSEGGEAFEGMAIHDALAAYPGKKLARIASSAFSIASFIPMACDEIEMTPNAYFMLHNPYAKAEGDDEDLGGTSEMLKQVKASMIAGYAARTGKTTDEMAAILKRETFLNAEQSVAMGLANRITGAPVIGRAFAKTHNLPHGVVTALFGAGSGGKEELPRRKPMADSVPVAATLPEIRAAFPRAKAEFILSCIERSMPMASVASAAVEEVMKENADLQARCLAMDEELKALKAKAEGDPADDEEKKDDEAPEAKGKPVARSGVKPVARAVGGGPKVSPRAEWTSKLDELVAKGKPKAEAARILNRQHPELREAMVAEANA